MNLLSKKWLGIIAISLCLFIAFSSYSTDKKIPNEQPASSNSTKQEVEVLIDHMGYSPASIAIAKGTKVTWTNKQFIPHTVTSDDNDLFDSGVMHKNDVFSYTFNKTGTFTYYCTHHSRMHGTVIVH